MKYKKILTKIFNNELSQYTELPDNNTISFTIILINNQITITNKLFNDIYSSFSPNTENDEINIECNFYGETQKRCSHGCCWDSIKSELEIIITNIKF